MRTLQGTVAVPHLKLPAMNGASPDGGYTTVSPALRHCEEVPHRLLHEYTM
jgi:hypothetical protein